MEKQCPYKHECAQHITAGDFRTEGGITPKLVIKERTVWCKTKFTKPDADTHGMYGPLPDKYTLYGSVILKNGEIVLAD